MSFVYYQVVHFLSSAQGMILDRSPHILRLVRRLIWVRSHAMEVGGVAIEVLLSLVPELVDLGDGVGEGSSVPSFLLARQFRVTDSIVTSLAVHAVIEHHLAMGQHLVRTRLNLAPTAHRVGDDWQGSLALRELSLLLAARVTPRLRPRVMRIVRGSCLTVIELPLSGILRLESVCLHRVSSVALIPDVRRVVRTLCVVLKVDSHLIVHLLVRNVTGGNSSLDATQLHHVRAHVWVEVAVVAVSHDLRVVPLIEGRIVGKGPLQVPP
mmetsp:Transcript_19364/g.29689  ORF Transcript_19364/g.29689 Transcript_19364/m.29689 type:complete len:267 (-) Transcript_19364:2479-3279(-)